MPPAAAHPVKVLIVDDHFVVRSGLTASLELDDDIQVVAEATRGEEAVAAYRQSRPDAVLIDLQMPGIGGIATIVALRAVDPSARILVFSAFARDDEIQAALDAGALGYLQKSATRDELLAAVRAVARGRNYLNSEVSHRIVAQRLGPAITCREREILSLIATGRANKEIGDTLKGIVQKF